MNQIAADQANETADGAADMAAGRPRQGSAWREPMLWLVWGGPLAVVVASLATAVIAVRLGDRPLADEPPPLRQGQGQADAMTPAMLARNHAQTPLRPAPAAPSQDHEPADGR